MTAVAPAQPYARDHRYERRDAIIRNAPRSFVHAVQQRDVNWLAEQATLQPISRIRMTQIP